MRDECPPAYVAFYQDLEAVHSVAELLRSIYRTVESSLSTSDRWKNRLVKWATLVPPRLGGLDLPVVQDSWPSLLATAFEDLVSIAGDQRVLMIWDEFPLMLYNISNRQGETVAIQLLDQLRALRQLHSRSLRFLLTGSVGLHLVIRSLQRAGNANDPTNDLYAITVPPLHPEPTGHLATALLRETEVDALDLPQIAALVTEQVEGFPYYVHHVIDQLHQLNRRIVPQDVASAVERLIYDPQDPANLRYYRKRISTYYDSSEQALALAILDALATRPLPLGSDEIINLVRHRIVAAADEEVRAVLTLLVEDHYLDLQRSGERMAYSFRWKIVKRWWRETRT